MQSFMVDDFNVNPILKLKMVNTQIDEWVNKLMETQCYCRLPPMAFQYVREFQVVWSVADLHPV